MEVSTHTVSDLQQDKKILSDQIEQKNQTIVSLQDRVKQLEHTVSSQQALLKAKDEELNESKLLKSDLFILKNQFETCAKSIAASSDALRLQQAQLAAHIRTITTKGSDTNASPGLDSRTQSFIGNSGINIMLPPLKVNSPYCPVIGATGRMTPELFDLAQKATPSYASKLSLTPLVNNAVAAPTLAPDVVKGADALLGADGVSPLTMEFSALAKDAVGLANMAQSVLIPDFKTNQSSLQFESSSHAISFMPKSPLNLKGGHFSGLSQLAPSTNSLPSSIMPPPSISNMQRANLPFVPKDSQVAMNSMYYAPASFIKDTPVHKGSNSYFNEHLEKLVDLKKFVPEAVPVIPAGDASRLSPAHPVSLEMPINAPPRVSISGSDFLEEPNRQNRLVSAPLFQVPIGVSNVERTPQQVEDAYDHDGDTVGSIQKPKHYDFSVLLGKDEENDAAVKQNLSNFPAEVENEATLEAEIKNLELLKKQQESFQRQQEEHQKRLHQRAPDSNKSDSSDDSYARTDFSILPSLPTGFGTDSLYDVDPRSPQSAHNLSKLGVVLSPLLDRTSFSERRSAIDTLLQSPGHLTIRKNLEHRRQSLSPVVAPFDFSTISTSRRASASEPITTNSPDPTSSPQHSTELDLL